MQRTVQFWRVVNVDGSPLDGEFPAGVVVAALELAKRRRQSRYRMCRDGMILIGHGLSTPASGYPMLILDKVRRENLPSVGESDGTRRPIGLNADQGLLEPTYCMFGPNNVVAMLTSGNGPRARRLAEYLGSKLSVAVSLDAVLTQNLDQVLKEMRVSSIEVAVPAALVSRDLVGGDWAGALEASRQMAADGGVIRVGMAVGQRGSRAEKDGIRRRIRDLINQLRGSSAVDQFSSVRVTGTIRGSRRSVDLHEDQFVEKVDVEAEILTDPDQAAKYALEILAWELSRNGPYLSRAVPHVEAQPASLSPRFIERPDDEQRPE